jgi:hypothetical protein
MLSEFVINTREEIRNIGLPLRCGDATVNYTQIKTLIYSAIPARRVTLLNHLVSVSFGTAFLARSVECSES